VSVQKYTHTHYKDYAIDFPKCISLFLFQNSNLKVNTIYREYKLLKINDLFHLQISLSVFKISMIYITSLL